MNSLKTKKYKFNKLVRDIVFYNLNDQCLFIKESVISDKSDQQNILKLKLIEEAEEVVNASTHQEMIVELADCLEVIRAIAKHIGVSYEEVELSRLDKYKEKGGFDHYKFINYVECEPNSSVDEYCKSSPSKYPEISDF